MSSKEIYVSTDVEADGPIPGPNSMLSFGSAAYTGGKELIGTFNQQAIASEQGLAQIRNPFPVACAVPPRCHAGGTVEGTREIGLR